MRFLNFSSIWNSFEVYFQVNVEESAGGDETETHCAVWIQGRKIEVKVCNQIYMPLFFFLNAALINNLEAPDLSIKLRKYVLGSLDPLIKYWQM